MMWLGKGNSRRSRQRRIHCSRGEGASGGAWIDEELALVFVGLKLVCVASDEQVNVEAYGAGVVSREPHILSDTAYFAATLPMLPYRPMVLLCGRGKFRS